MLDRLAVKNFKSIGETGVNLEMKPLTILVGPNGAGKSATWEALALLCQSVPGQLQVSGRFVQFSTPLELVHRQSDDAWVGVEIALGPNDLGYRLDYQPATGQSIQKVMSQGAAIVTVKVVGDQRKSYRIYLVTSDNKEFVGGHVLPVLPEGMFKKEMWQDYADVATLSEAERVAVEVRAFLSQGAVFLSGERGRIPLAAPPSLQATSVGFRGEDVLSILTLIFGSRRYSDIEDRITKYAQKFGLLGLNAGPRPGNQVGADYLDPVLKVPVNLSLASFGARQLIPIITQLFWSRPDSTVVIEEPEISLHPESQLRLLDLFGAAIKDGKQVVVTTHSYFLLLGLQHAAKNGWLSPDDVGIYHLEKGRGGTKAKRIPLTKEGFLSKGAESFLRVERQLMEDWTSTLPEA